MFSGESTIGQIGDLIRRVKYYAGGPYMVIVPETDYRGSPTPVDDEYVNHVSEFLCSKVIKVMSGPCGLSGGYFYMEHIIDRLPQFKTKRVRRAVLTTANENRISSKVINNRLCYYV